MTERGFDAVLLMGSLYHLVAETNREAALKEAFDRLREGGIQFSAFLSRFGVIGDQLRNVPGWVENQAEARSLLRDGRRPDDVPRGGFRGYFARVPEIASLHEALGFETLTLAGGPGRRRELQPASGGAPQDVARPAVRGQRRAVGAWGGAAPALRRQAKGMNAFIINLDLDGGPAG